MADPIVRRTSDKPSAFEIYDAAIKADEFSDNDNDTARQMGTSVRAGAKVLQGLGLLTEYSWVTSADEAARWIGGQDEHGEFVGGPVVIGVNWYNSMFDTDSEGLLHVAGNIAGGHSVCINKWYQRLGLFGGIQSWSLPWGIYGHFLISGENVNRLFKEDGEGCTPTESRTR